MFIHHTRAQLLRFHVSLSNKAVTLTGSFKVHSTFMSPLYRPVFPNRVTGDTPTVALLILDVQSPLSDPYIFGLGVSTNELMR